MMKRKKWRKSLYSIGLLSILNFLLETEALAQSALDNPIQIAEQPICYMRTSDGRLMDLSRLCTRPTAQVQVVVTGTFRQDNLLLGNVVNRTGKSVRNVRVNYEGIAPDGSVRDRGVAMADPGSLTPGQTALFEVDVEPGLTIRTTTVLWDE